MTDNEMILYLGLDPSNPKAREYVTTLPVGRRALFERMKRVEEGEHQGCLVCRDLKVNNQ